MITLKTYKDLKYVVKPTIFPDKTSQVWHLPEELLGHKWYTIIWNFEEEREIIDLLSLRKLLKHACEVNLYIPYMPYARQDKKVSNDSTFNLAVICQILRTANFNSVTTLDCHNSEAMESYLGDTFYSNTRISGFHNEVIDKNQYNFIVFPDRSAAIRYTNTFHRHAIVCDKIRNPEDGRIVDIKVNYAEHLKANDKLLIIDDICDGGATFIQVANKLHEMHQNLVIDLFVTHGIFSKGREHLLTNGINKIYTTNSLIKNEDGFNV